MTSTQIVIGVSGELDLETAPTLQGVLRTFTAEHRQSIVLDLSRLTFLDAAGLGVIAATAHQLQLRRRSLSVRNAAPRCHRLFAITRLDHLCESPP